MAAANGACAPSPSSQSTNSSTATISSPTSSPATGALGAGGCQPASPLGALTAEVQGTATGGTVWAWFMQSYPPQAGVEDKTIWRLDGPNTAYPPVFTMIGPANARGHLDWGPAYHMSSTWNRPGDEYGTGLLFPVAGCWDVHVSVGGVTGDVYVVVVS
jgi:hypothetical protein